MVWLPILFVCLNSGNCQFIYDEPQVSEKACIKEVNNMGAKADKHPEVQGWKGTCVPVAPGKKI